MNTEKTGKFIAELRKENNITQVELASRINVSDKAISRWETGRGMPDIGNIEALAETFYVTATELLRGERLTDPISTDEIQEADETLLSLVGAYLRKKRFKYILAGILAGVLLVTVGAVHLTSPIYIKDYQDAIQIVQLDDGRIAASTSEDVAGIDISSQIEDPDTHQKQVFVSCCKTRWSQLRGQTSEKLVLLGGSDIDAVYYYPTGGEDALLYSKVPQADSSGGVVTLPRLVYNYWLLLGILLSVAGFIVCWICRRKHFAGTLFKLAMLPVAFTISIPICLAGHMDEVYNAEFYLTGIVLLGMAIYAAILAISRMRDPKQL